MRMASALVLLLVIAALPITSSASARSIDVEISVMKYDWMSNETIELSVEVSDAPFNQQFVAQFSIEDLSGTKVLVGEYVFQSSGPVTQFPLLVKHFFDTSNFYFLQISILDSNDVVISTGEISFMVFRNTMMPQISNLLVFGDSLSDMGNAKDSILNVPDVPP